MDIYQSVITSNILFESNLLGCMRKERIKCMFDTVIFNRIVENDSQFEFSLDTFKK